MTETVEQARRALFEARMKSVFESEGYSSYSLVSIMERGSDGKYYSVRLAGAWEGFNAALDSVEIELPSCFEGFGHSAEVARVATDGCADAIDDLNLGLRIK